MPLAPLPSALLGAPVVFRPPGESGRPVVTSAILDTGSSFTAINIEAASEVREQTWQRRLCVVS